MAATCLRALTDFLLRGEALLDLAEKQSKEGSLQEFIREKIRIEQKESLLGLIDAAAALYKSLSVKRKRDVDELLEKYNQDAQLQAAVQVFQQLQDRWDGFLQRLDDELQLSSEILDADNQSKEVSPDVPLIDARTGEAVTLQKYLGRGKKLLLVLIRQFSCLLCRLHLKDLEKNKASLDVHSLEVLVVSFGCREGALHWLEETGCPFHMLLDPHRKMYSAFGLAASLSRVLNFGNMMLYAEYVADNFQFPRGLASIQDDMFQLGGDFVLDERGRVLFSHGCQTPVDRPPPGEILSALRRTSSSADG